MGLISALGISGCAGYYRPSTAYQQRYGIDGWVVRRMNYLVSFYLDCPSNQVERTDYGRIPRTEWYRHTFAGCGQTYEMWTICNSRGCGYETGLDERASVEFECPVGQVTVHGVGPYMRATGCGRTALYRDDDGEWIMSPDGSRPTSTYTQHGADAEPVPQAQGQVPVEGQIPVQVQGQVQGQ